jgi:hypothetical protein
MWILLAHHEDHTTVKPLTLTLKISRHIKQQVLKNPILYTNTHYRICVTPTTRISVEPKFKMFHTQSSNLPQVYNDNGITKIKYILHQIFPTSMYIWKKTECPQSPLLILIFHIYFIHWNVFWVTYVRRFISNKQWIDIHSNSKS